MPHAVLLHNAKATHGSRRFTHPDEKIMCAVHTGTAISGQKGMEGGGGGVGWGGSLKVNGLKAPDRAEEEEEVLQSETEFRPEASAAAGGESPGAEAEAGAVRGAEQDHHHHHHHQ